MRSITVSLASALCICCSINVFGDTQNSDSYAICTEEFDPTLNYTESYEYKYMMDSSAVLNDIVICSDAGDEYYRSLNNIALTLFGSTKIIRIMNARDKPDISANYSLIYFTNLEDNQSSCIQQFPQLKELVEASLKDDPKPQKGTCYTSWRVDPDNRIEIPASMATSDDWCFELRLAGLFGVSPREFDGTNTCITGVVRAYLMDRFMEK